MNQVKVTGLKVCDVRQSQSLTDRSLARTVNITLLLTVDIDGRPSHKTIELIPGVTYDTVRLVNEK